MKPVPKIDERIIGAIPVFADREFIFGRKEKMNSRLLSIFSSLMDTPQIADLRTIVSYMTSEMLSSWNVSATVHSDIALGLKSRDYVFDAASALFFRIYRIVAFGNDPGHHTAVWYEAARVAGSFACAYGINPAAYAPAQTAALLWSIIDATLLLVHENLTQILQEDSAELLISDAAEHLMSRCINFQMFDCVILADKYQSTRDTVSHAQVFYPNLCAAISYAL